MDRSQIDSLIGGTLVDSNGKDVGKIGMIYLDDQTNEPDWVSVNTGLFGTKETFVPLKGARPDGDNLHVPYTKDQIKDAPNVDAEEHLDVEHEERLYRHYGRDYGTGRDGDRDDQRSTEDADAAGGVQTAHGRDDDDRNVDTAGTHGRQDHDVDEAGVPAEAGATHDRHADDLDDSDRSRMTDERAGDNVDRDRDRVAGSERDRRDDGVTLDEDRSDVGTEPREAGTARLRKYVVTEEKSITVPVTHEEIRVEREPTSDRDASGSEIRDGAQRVDLDAAEDQAHSDRPQEGEVDDDRSVTDKAKGKLS